ncbi:3-methyl-2-oxobutanoate hydroxymethyltransferase [Humisphaera borealis]|uniref:3-methyl-2-oxobutanoate hydroxymethyltransferase n=1 Tax=Humisphaera borealis TaxID=2807512 RepID=A0A7M2X268_9BACT|nr:3-methyl-2-oxobutanoate hydroxymethyltransferase [Humisphaera borealis]QOV91838.1 3-methyl-2-oxobutanoate hydroxymethyltransferase [Humisphaera borealis]
MPLSSKFTLANLRAARTEGTKVPMLTCYDYTTARLMQQAGVPALLVGDSAANVILGHPTTLPVPLSFMIEIAAAVRRGAPAAFVVADMPFGSYAGSLGTAVRHVCQMASRSGCDAVKLEVTVGHSKLVRSLADAGVAVMAHLGLRPQSVATLGGYKAQGRTARQADEIVATARAMEQAGAVAILLEAVPNEVSAAIVEQTSLPVIGCGAGPSCHGFVFVTHDAVGLTDHTPRFAPKLGDLATPAIECYRRYVQQVSEGRYPSAEHGYEMPAAERAEFGKPF